MLITALCFSSVGMTGCSSIWSFVGDKSYEMAEFTKFAWLRGPAKTDDVSFAEATPTSSGVLKTEVGEYVPTQVEVYSDNVGFVDTSQHPCPEGTYLTAENSCMSLETDSYDFPETTDVPQVVDTSPVPCPEGTFLNAENACMYLETEEYDFGDEVNTVEQFIDTSPVPCPEGTYLNAKNQCMYLETETLDFANDLETVAPSTQTSAQIVIPPAQDVVTSQDFAVSSSIECPEGFTLTAGNSCMFVGSGTDTGN